MFRRTLVFIHLFSKVGIESVFDTVRAILTRNGVFVGKAYCSDGLFVLNVQFNENASSSTYIAKLSEIRHGRLG